MSRTRWIIVAVIVGLFTLGSGLVLEATLPKRPKLPVIFGPIEENSPLGLLLNEARAAEQAHDYQRAVDLYSSALKIEKSANFIHRDLLRRRAFAYEDLRQYERAEADFTAALKVEPVDPELYARRGYFFMRRNRYDDALADFRKGARLDPRNGTYPYGEARVHETRGDYTRAIERYSDAIRIDPNSATYYAERGSAHNYAKMHEQAYADYDKALRIGYPRPNPRETGLSHLGRGYASLQLGQYRRAIEDFDLVLKEVPRASNALAWRGSAYQMLGENALAIADFKAALAIAPNHKGAAEKLKELEAP
jgi:tetratricopeptide (TPR) repeat protein